MKSSRAGAALAMRWQRSKHFARAKSNRPNADAGTDLRRGVGARQLSLGQ
jgi:hypothetical protein